MKRKLWGPLLCGVLLCSLFLLRVPAAAEDVGGTFGDNGSWSWSLDGEDCLTIEGSGEMPNFSLGSRPWEEHSDSIRSVKVSDGVTSIGDYAFASCRDLALAELPSGLRTIGQAAFFRCGDLTLTVLPDGVTSIGDWAFAYCAELALTELPDGVTSIGINAFDSCGDLALTELPSGLTAIGRAAFSGCGNLALTELPSGLCTIGDFAFSGCTSLALRELPSGLTSIGNCAFRSCAGLTAVTFTGETAPKLGRDIFFECNKLTMVCYPAGAPSYDAVWVMHLGLHKTVPALSAYPVTVTPEGRGAASADFVLAPVGQTVTLTAEPESGWRLREWQVVPDGVMVSEGQFTMPDGAVKITAVFEELPAPPVHVHSWSPDWSVDGESHWHACGGCSQRRDMEAHTPGEWVTDREATYTEEGRRHRACTVCGYVLETEAVPALPRPSGPDRDSGGGEDRDEGGFPPLTPRAEGGGVTVSPSRPEKGDTVTVRLRPRDGYEAEGVSVTGPDGSALEVRENGNGGFTFTQPEGRVTVRASFRPVREPEEPEEAGPFRDVRPGDWCF